MAITCRSLILIINICVVLNKDNAFVLLKKRIARKLFQATFCDCRVEFRWLSDQQSSSIPHELSARATGASSFFLTEEKSFLRTLTACVITRDKRRTAKRYQAEKPVRQHSTLSLVSCLTRHVSPYQESSGQSRWLVPHPRTNASARRLFPDLSRSLSLSLSLSIFPRVPEKSPINIINFYIFSLYFSYIFFIFIAHFLFDMSDCIQANFFLHAKKLLFC